MSAFENTMRNIIVSSLRILHGSSFWDLFILHLLDLLLTFEFLFFLFTFLYLNKILLYSFFKVFLEHFCNSQCFPQNFYIFVYLFSSFRIFIYFYCERFKTRWIQLILKKNLQMPLRSQQTISSFCKRWFIVVEGRIFRCNGKIEQNVDLFYKCLNMKSQSIF